MKMEAFTKEIVKMAKDMDREYSIGLTGQFMTENGKITKSMGKVYTKLLIGNNRK